MIDSLPPVELSQSRGAPPAAVQVLAADPLLAQRPLADWLQAVPGLHAAERGNHAQDAQLSLRGFGARTAFGVRGLRVYVDGIPQSTPDGSGSSAGLPLGLLERIEVLRGPFSALYGTNSGGVIALHTRLPREASSAARLLVAVAGERALELEGGAAGWRVAAGHWRWDGWRPQSQAERRSLEARWGDARWRLQLSLFDQQAKDPQGLSPAQWALDSQGTAAPALNFDTRKRLRAGQLGLRWQDGGWSLAAWWGRRGVQQWQSIPVAVQAAPSHPGGVIDLDREHGGLDLRRQWTLDAWQLSTGLAFEFQQDDRRGYENFVGSRTGVSGALRRDEGNHARSLDAYAQARRALGENLQLHLGLRAGCLALGSRDHFLANGDDSGERSLNTFSPMLGLSQGLGEHRLFLHAGAAQETPTLNELAYGGAGGSAGGFNSSLRPQRSRQIEAGWRWQGWQLTAFAARSRDEIVVASSSGGRASYMNGGRSRRQGVELGWREELAPGWQLELAASQLSARLQGGGRLPGAPARRAHLQLRWQQDGLSLQTRWQAQSRLFAAPGQAAPGFGLLQVQAQWRPKSLGPWRLQAGVDNLLDRRHAASVIVGEANGRFLEPGAPRRWFLGLVSD